MWRSAFVLLFFFQVVTAIDVGPDLQKFVEKVQQTVGGVYYTNGLNDSTLEWNRRLPQRYFNVEIDAIGIRILFNPLDCLIHANDEHGKPRKHIMYVYAGDSWPMLMPMHRTMLERNSIKFEIRFDPTKAYVADSGGSAGGSEDETTSSSTRSTTSGDEETTDDETTNDNTELSADGGDSSTDGGSQDNTTDSGSSSTDDDNSQNKRRRSLNDVAPTPTKPKEEKPIDAYAGYEFTNANVTEGKGGIYHREFIYDVTGFAKGKVANKTTFSPSMYAPSIYFTIQRLGNDRSELRVEHSTADNKRERLLIQTDEPIEFIAVFSTLNEYCTVFVTHAHPKARGWSFNSDKDPRYSLKKPKLNYNNTIFNDVVSIAAFLFVSMVILTRIAVSIIARFDVIVTGHDVPLYSCTEHSLSREDRDALEKTQPSSPRSKKAKKNASGGKVEHGKHGSGRPQESNLDDVVTAVRKASKEDVGVATASKKSQKSKKSKDKKSKRDKKEKKAKKPASEKSLPEELASPDGKPSPANEDDQPSLEAKPSGTSMRHQQREAPTPPNDESEKMKQKHKSATNTTQRHTKKSSQLKAKKKSQMSVKNRD